MLRIAPAWLLVAALLSMSRDSELRATDWPHGDVYLAGQRAITLVRSENYFAVSTAQLDRLRVLATLRATGTIVIERSSLLDRHGIALVRVVPKVRRAQIAKMLTAAGVDLEWAPAYASGGIDLLLVNDFTVQLTQRAPETIIEALMKRFPEAGIQKDQEIPGRYRLTFDGVTARERLAVVNEIAQQPDVLFAVPDFLLILPRGGQGTDPLEVVAAGGPRAGSTSKEGAMPATGRCAGWPNDPLLPVQWALGKPDRISAGIDAVKAWATTTGSSQVILAIVDDGIDFAHPDLTAKRAGQFDAVDGDEDASPAHARDAHGTASAGVAAASTNNCEGVAGVAWSARLYGVRVLDGTDGVRVTQPTIVARGIRAAVGAGARVLSIGVTGGETQPVIDMAIDAAIEAGAILVFPAGNENGDVSYPARLAAKRAILAVAATDRHGDLKRPNAAPDGEPWGSNAGPEISIAAPGVGIVTTDLTGERGFDASGDYYTYFNGTSAAAPMVAGAAALLLSVRPDAKPAEVRRWIECGGQSVAAPGFTVARLNVARSLEAATRGCDGLARPSSVLRVTHPGVSSAHP